jgi:hypothetical protein
VRPLCYRSADLVLICFALPSVASYEQVTQRWVPELRRHTCALHAVPFVVVGALAHEQQHSLHSHDDSEVRRTAMQALGAAAYWECSAETAYQLNETFQSAITHALHSRRRPAPVFAPASAASTCSPLTAAAAVSCDCAQHSGVYDLLSSTGDVGAASVVMHVSCPLPSVLIDLVLAFVGIDLVLRRPAPPKHS